MADQRVPQGSRRELPKKRLDSLLVGGRGERGRGGPLTNTYGNNPSLGLYYLRSIRCTGYAWMDG